MKRNKSLLSLIALFTVMGCGSSTVSDSGQKAEEENPSITEQQKELLDLTGLWIQEDKSSETRMVAEIKENTIGIFFILEGDEDPWTYWIGTYEKPTDSSDEYTWTSENTYSGNGLLASNAESKEFSYKGGKLSYSVTIQGETGTVTLVKGEWDTSKIPASIYESGKTSQTDFKQLEISESGWTVKDGKWLKYFVDLYNPNDTVAVELPGYRITARDANGVVLGTEDQILSIIYPGQHFVYGSQAFSVDEVPASVDFTLLDVKDYNRKNTSTPSPYQPLEIVNTAIRSDQFVGEIKNSSDEDYDSVIVIVLCKNENGELIDAEITFVNDVHANSNTAFSIRHYGTNADADVSFYAYEWL